MLGFQPKKKNLNAMVVHSITILDINVFLNFIYRSYLLFSGSSVILEFGSKHFIYYLYHEGFLFKIYSVDFLDYLYSL